MLGVISDSPAVPDESIFGGPAVTGPKWTYEFAFPAAVVGPAHLIGSCEDPSTGTQPFAFNPLAIDIQTNRRLAVLPTSNAAPGSTLVITSHGPGCDQTSSVEISLHLASTWVYPTPTITGDQQSQWRATLTLPSDLQPGSYTLTAECTHPREVTAIYPPATITIGHR